MEEGQPSLLYVIPVSRILESVCCSANPDVGTTDKLN